MCILFDFNICVIYWRMCILSREFCKMFCSQNDKKRFSILIWLMLAHCTIVTICFILRNTMINTNENCNYPKIPQWTFQLGIPWFLNLFSGGWQFIWGSMLVHIESRWFDLLSVAQWTMSPQPQWPAGVWKGVFLPFLFLGFSVLLSAAGPGTTWLSSVTCLMAPQINFPAAHDHGCIVSEGIITLWKIKKLKLESWILLGHRSQRTRNVDKVTLELFHWLPRCRNPLNFIKPISCLAQLVLHLNLRSIYLWFILVFIFLIRLKLK